VRALWQWLFWLRSVRVLCALAGALCCGGTSRSVRMLREMAAEEVGLTLCVCLLYLGGRVVAVGTEVPTTCF
jgi:hypothetical protein